MRVPRYGSREGIQGAAGSNADLSSLISSHPLIIPLNFAHPASSHGMCPPETSAMFTPLHLPFALHTCPSAWNAISTCQLGWNVLVIHVLFKFLLISLALELVGHIRLPKL